MSSKELATPRRSSQPLGGAGLIAKSKTGKSTAKRWMPETDNEFQARFAAKYAEPGMFPHRETLYISREQAGAG